MPKKEGKPRNIAVFCASSDGADPAFLALADATGRAIHKGGYGLVYGGGGTGLMGAVARAVSEPGGYVLGVIPQFLLKAEHALETIEKKIVPDMHTRKLEMFRASDAFIILPGGIGTIEEAVEMICWQRLQLHQKPIIFVSDTGYWASLMDFIRQTITAKLSPDWLLDEIHTVKSPQNAIDLIEAAWEAPPRELRPVLPIDKA